MCLKASLYCLLCCMLLSIMSGCNPGSDDDSRSSDNNPENITAALISDNSALGGVKPEMDLLPIGYSPIPLAKTSIPASKGTAVVASDGSADYLFITDAINAQPRPATILVKAGEYHESVLSISSDLVLIAEPEVRVALTSIDVYGDNLSLDISGFTFMASSAQSEASDFFRLYGSSQYILLHNNQFIAEQRRFEHLLRVSGESKHSALSYADKVEDPEGKQDIAHQYLVLSANTFQGFTTDTLVAVSNFAELIMRNNEFIDNTGNLLIEGMTDQTQQRVELTNNLFNHAVQNTLALESPIKITEIEFVEISFNTIVADAQNELGSDAPVFQLSNASAWTLDLHHNDLQRNHHGLWIGRFESLKANSMLTNNVWPVLHSTRQFMVRTNSNNDFNDPLNSQFFNSEASFMANILQN